MNKQKNSPNLKIKKVNYQNNVEECFTTIMETAELLSKNGYPIIPLRTNNAKIPAISGWTSFKPSTDLNDFIDQYPDCGAGILLGQNITDNHSLIAIDLDVYDEKKSSEMVQYCHKKFGESPVREGEAPKKLMFYQLKGHTKKFTSKEAQDGSKIEILSKGQHAVAFGIHPNTNCPYSWPNGTSILNVPINKLPIISIDQVLELLDKFHKLAGLHPLNQNLKHNLNGIKKSEFEKHVQNDIKRLNWSLEKVKRLIQKLNPDMCYSDWFLVGAALNFEYKGKSDGFQVWYEWSSLGSKFQQTSFEKMQEMWQAMGKPKREAKDLVGLPTIIKMSKMTEFQALEKNENEKGKTKTRISHISDIIKSGKNRNWLVKNCIECGAFGELFAPPASYKSFIAMDLALSVASGKPWHGLEVVQGWSLYVYGEGVHGAGDRLLAWGKEYDIDVKTLDFYGTESPIDFLSMVEVTDIQIEIENLIDKLGSPPSFVIVDTLARNFGSGDENSTKDMNNFITNLHDGICLKYKCACLVVHHTSKTNRNNSRGSGALEGACDFIFQINDECKNRIKLINKKQKNAETLTPLHFEFKRVDQHDEMKSSSLVPILAEPLVKKVAPPSSKTVKGKLFKFLSDKWEMGNKNEFKQNEAIKEFISQFPNVNLSTVRSNIDRFKKSKNFGVHHRADDSNNIWITNVFPSHINNVFHKVDANE